MFCRVDGFKKKISTDISDLSKSDSSQAIFATKDLAKIIPIPIENL